MGEYQFYDFLALDRRLSADQRAELRGLSSRATITATSFTNHYDFGDFHGDPDRLVDRYFDAHLHLAEWGSREVVLKAPAAALPLAEAGQYTSETIVTARSVPGATVLAVRIGPDDPGASDDDLEVWDAEGDRQGWGYDGWDDEDTAGSGTLTTIADARDLILAGDRRLLYLAWLVAVARGEVDDDVLEPPVPPGLDDLDDALDTFAQFFNLSPELIEAAAAERTGPRLDAGLDDVEPWLASLPRSRTDDLLHRVVLGEGAAVGVELRRELREELGVMDGDGVLDDVEPRTAGELLYAEGALVAARERQEADRRAAAAAAAATRAAEAARARRTALAAEGDAVWARVEAMAIPSIPATYDEVVATLLDLREVLAQQGRAAEFTERVAALRASQARRVTLIRKLAAAGLISPGS